MATVVPSFIEKTSSASSHTFSAPSGIAGMSGLIVVCTGTSSGTGITLSAPGATVTELDDGQATNVRYAVYRVTGLSSGATVTVSIAGDPNTIGVGQYYTDEYTFPSSINPGAIRSSSSTSTTTNSISPASVGQRILVVGVERTTNSTSISNVTTSDGETVTTLRFGEGSGSSMTSSVYIGRFDAANTTSHTATITYSNSSQNGYAVLVPLTAVSGGGGDPGGGEGGGSGGSTLAPVIRSSSALGLPSTDSSADCPAPAGIQIGDYLLAILTYDADGSLAAATASAFPAPFLSVAPAAASDNSPFIEISGKVATSTDAAASGFAFSNTADSDTTLTVIAIQTGTYSTSTPIGVVGAFTEQVRTSVTLQTAPSITGSVDQLLLAIFGADINNVPASSPFQEYPSSGPAGMTRVRSVRGGANWALSGVYAQALTSAGATGTRSVTPSNAGTQNGWAAGLIAVNPGTVTGGGSANTTGFFLDQ